MKINEIIDSKNPAAELSAVLSSLHIDGPCTSDILETISLYKKNHPEVFSDFEEKIISALGLFYKIKNPSNVYSFMLSAFGQQHEIDYGECLTPVQASIRFAVDHNKNVSISAPTSAGKSYSIRDFISDQEGDAIVVVPSRALIAEYINSMKRKFRGDKHVMISSFVDNVFTSRKLRRIFVLTPERSRDLFLSNLNLNIGSFFFDEAQISDENERGIIFDVLVRRVKKHFPNSKIIFAHPFVENPEAQFAKHNFSAEDSFARSYTYGAVGKICIYQHDNNKCYYFSPHVPKGHLIKNCREFSGKFEEFAFNGDHSVLVYVSKSSIYRGAYLKDFHRYIERFNKIDNPKAIATIEAIKHLLGADQKDFRSDMVALLEKGVVIHHGSVPLEVRFLVEEFIKEGFARICFATSTLAQGINMPFDIVWLDNMRFLGGDENSKSLAFKNLIGRAGRLSSQKIFDYGYVFTKNPVLFSDRINSGFRLSEVSIIESPVDEANVDSKELLESIRDDAFDEDKQMPIAKVERLSQNIVLESAKNILDAIYRGDGDLSENLSGISNKIIREQIRSYFQVIYESSINRNLYEGENSVFRVAISILLQMMQGRSFKEIVGTRYSYVSNRDDGHKGYAKFSQPASRLPNSMLLHSYSLFKENTRAAKVTYDAIVFDTYDYVDQVISFSLADAFIATFKIYHHRTNDHRARLMIDLLKYGTNDKTQTLLMRYGFPPEEVFEISKYIQLIDEEEIIFTEEIERAPSYIQEMTDWYRP